MSIKNRWETSLSKIREKILVLDLSKLTFFIVSSSEYFMLKYFFFNPLTLLAHQIDPA